MSSPVATPPRPRRREGLWQRLRRSGHIHGDVASRFAAFLPKGRLLDLPAGRGENARPLAAAGYEVVAADLFPEHCSGAGLTRERVDMTQPLPYPDASFDGVLHSEGIEHIDNQLALLGEFARILRPGGVLITTTPNLLHLEGRLTRLLTGHAFRNRTIVAGRAGYWGGEPDGGATYFGHVFLIDAFQLRFYLTHVGLDVVDVDTTKYSPKSLLLAPVLGPPVWWSTRRMLRKRRSRVEPALRARLQAEVLSGPLLFGRKLIMTARKPGAPG